MQTAGTAAYPDWFAAYLVPFLHRDNAIAILPNYRLAPEHTGNDILEDISDFHRWFRNALPAFLSSRHPGIKVDFERVLVQGDSAGSWCALQAILTQPKGTFKAAFLQYPVTCAFHTSPDDILMGQAIPPKETLDEFLASIVTGTIISSATPPARSWVAPMLRAHGLWKHYFGDERHVMPDTAIEDAKFFVPTYVVHGRDDTVVPVKWTHSFVEKAKGLFPDVRMELVTPPGDHGFDGEMYEEEEEWLAGFLKGVEEIWLA